ncbi:membrane protein [Bacillus sp. MUM 116]|uniref:YitT family protein n=1 Tax=Bacillus sp. MUM 116 TaxID=1678002 RepID=UPI0008F5B4D0|nr:YitT family protein [Bacillus sp. MUM 116]OIK16073.1 membrane protein [Bacillus sp. MUM 116]
MYKERIKSYINEKRSAHFSFFKRGTGLLIGVSLVAASLQLLLVKNYIIDGGIVGISILLSHISDHEMEYYILLLNAPFLLLGLLYLGKRFLMISLGSLLFLSLELYMLEPIPAITNNPILVILLGGICLGMGVGMIIRFGGSLDGTEILAIILSKRTSFSIGQYVLFFNFFIFFSAIFVFGLIEAAYSLATFCVACKTIDLALKNIYKK